MDLITTLGCLAILGGVIRFIGCAYMQEMLLVLSGGGIFAMFAPGVEPALVLAVMRHRRVSGDWNVPHDRGSVP